jgi:predicted nucleic-acid-binding protein
MIGLDTNVLARYIAQDDPLQTEQATALIESLTSAEPGFVTLISVTELVWVMQSCYHSTRGEVVEILETLLRSKEIVVEHADLIWQALRRYAGTSADFADSLIERCAHSAGCEYTVTFDRHAVKQTGMRLVNSSSTHA